MSRTNDLGYAGSPIATGSNHVSECPDFARKGPAHPEPNERVSFLSEQRLIGNEKCTSSPTIATLVFAMVDEVERCALVCARRRSIQR
jgi:hypothetical protein